MVENCQVNDCQKRLLLAEIEQLRAAIRAAVVVSEYPEEPVRWAGCGCGCQEAADLASVLQSSAPGPPSTRGYEV